MLRISSLPRYMADFNAYFFLSFFLLSFISFFCCVAHGLKDLKIFVPEAVIMGNAATLSCQYDLNKVSETSLMDAEETETSLTLSTSTACLIIIITRTLSSLSFASIFLLHYFRLFILRASASGLTSSSCSFLCRLCYIRCVGISIRRSSIATCRARPSRQSSLPFRALMLM